MTIADLLRHTAGLTYGFFGNTPVDQMYRKASVLSQTDLAAMAAVMKDIPLQFQPGTRWHYSVAVDVTGYLIERIVRVIKRGKSTEIVEGKMKWETDLPKPKRKSRRRVRKA